MARISIILVFMIWLSWTPSHQHIAPGDSVFWLRIAFGFLCVAILGLALYSRVLSRTLAGATYPRVFVRFNRVMKLARLMIPTWFALVVFGLDFPVLVNNWSGRWGEEALSPGFFLGTLPAMFAWVGLWWAAYPAERAFREQSFLVQIDSNIPIRNGPTLLQYLLANVRLQLLFMFAPVLSILVLRDLITAAAFFCGAQLTEAHNLIISIASMLPVLLAAPVLLVRIVPTEPLPPSPLRDRLEELCRRNGLKVSNILLWKTGGNLGNAAVMGILPRVRYLLVTDLLLETMPDEHILAVFAHEIGHVMHRHLLWMAGCAMCLMFAMAGPADSLLRSLRAYTVIPPTYGEFATFLLVGPFFLAVFGLVVRRLERQADVFAARNIPQLLADQAPSPTAQQDQNHVGSLGATLVCGALKRVAQVNNVPLNAREWLHGSIASRIAFLRGLSEDPPRTARFDLFMRRMLWAIFVLLLTTGAWTAWNIIHANP